MPGKLTNSVSLPLKDRLSWKFAALFAAAFLTVFFSCLVYDIFVTGREDRQTDSDSLAQPALKPIEPNIENDLTKVLALDAMPNGVEIKDPFVDRSNIMGAVGLAKTPGSTTTVIKPVAQQSSAAKGDSGNRSGTAESTVRGLPSQSSQGEISIAPPAGYVASKEATETRMRERQDRMRLGQDGGQESTVLAIDDLLPVGIVSGGSGGTEIIFYSQALTQTFSFPVGTPFYDGWLVDWRQEGVGFGRNNRNGAVFLKSWSHSVKQPTSNNSPAGNLPEQIAGND